jgi:hypothetical protein
MKQHGFAEKGCILGGVQAVDRHIACFFVGTEKARNAFELSSTFFESSAFWFVLIVATHELVTWLKIIEEGSNALGRTDPLKELLSNPTGGLQRLGCFVSPKSISITEFVPRKILFESYH